MSLQSEQLQNLVQNAGNASGKVAAGSGLGTMIMDFFGSNAAAIGAMCTALSVSFFIIFGLVNIYMKKRMDEAYYRAKIKQELGIDKDE